MRYLSLANQWRKAHPWWALLVYMSVMATALGLLMELQAYGSCQFSVFAALVMVVLFEVLGLALIGIIKLLG